MSWSQHDFRGAHRISLYKQLGLSGSLQEFALLGLIGRVPTLSHRLANSLVALTHGEFSGQEVRRDDVSR